MENMWCGFNFRIDSYNEQKISCKLYWPDQKKQNYYKNNNEKHSLGPYLMSSFTDIDILTQVLLLVYKRGK